MPVWRAMPIRPYLDGHPFDPETVRILDLAFELTGAALKIEDGNEQAKEVLAEKLIELAEQGERDPEQLCEGVLRWVRDGWAKGPGKNQNGVRSPRSR
jgi:hypothetical protein